MRPKYRIMIEKNNQDLTVQEIALVDEPAVEIDFLYFNKQEKPRPLYFNEEQMIVAGVLMLPDKLIYRYDEEMGEYDVFFTPEDIENARYNFKKYGLTGQFNEGHTDKKVNVVLIEDYILDEGDTRVEKYGFKDLPKGTWFGITKVEDYDTWTKIKSGELRGFSVEGLFQLKQTFKKESFIVEPNLGETKDEFIGRCIGIEIDGGMDEDQAAAVCYTKWEDYGLDKLFNLLDTNELGVSKDDFQTKFEIHEMTSEVSEYFAVSWQIPDWMKPKDTGKEITEPTDNQINRQEKVQGRPPVYYFYDKRPGAQFDGAGIIDARSRDFCVRLVNQNKYFTEADIEKMSLTAGFDVFLYAGGKNCRHNWFIAIPIVEEFEKKDEKLNKNEVIDISSIKNKKSKMKKTVKSIQKFVIETELQNGTEVIVDADELVVGARVEVKVAEQGDVAETDMYQPAPDGEHILADGTVITTEGGVIASITPATPADETTEDVEAGKKKEKMEITEEDLVVIMEALQPKFDEIMSMIAELASKLADTQSTETTEQDLKSENFNKAKSGLSSLEKLIAVKERFGIK